MFLSVSCCSCRVSLSIRFCIRRNVCFLCKSCFPSSTTLLLELIEKRVEPSPVSQSLTEPLLPLPLQTTGRNWYVLRLSFSSSTSPLVWPFFFYKSSFLRKGDTIPHVITWLFPSLIGSFLSSRQFVITFCTLTISFPLSLYRNIENLSKASAIALFSMVLIILTVIFRGPAMPQELKGDPSLRVSWASNLSLLSLQVLTDFFVNLLLCRSSRSSIQSTSFEV